MNIILALYHLDMIDEYEVGKRNQIDNTMGK